MPAMCQVVPLKRLCVRFIATGEDIINGEVANVMSVRDNKINRSGFLEVPMKIQGVSRMEMKWLKKRKEGIAKSC